MHQSLNSPLIPILKHLQPEGAISFRDTSRNANRRLDIAESVMSVVRRKAVFGRQSVEFEPNTVVLINRPLKQLRLSTLRRIYYCQDIEAVVSAELSSVDIRLQVLIESLPQKLLVELYAIVSNPCRWSPSFRQPHDSLRKLEKRGQRRVGDLPRRYASHDQRLRRRDDVGSKTTAQVDAITLGEVFVGPDCGELQGLIKWR